MPAAGVELTPGLSLVWRRQLAAPQAPVCPASSNRDALPVGGSIVAVVGEEVEVQLPEDMQGDAAIGGGHVVVGLSEHGIEAVQGHVLAQQPVCEPVDLQQPLQLLAEREPQLLRTHLPYRCTPLALTHSCHIGESPSHNLPTAGAGTRTPAVACDNVPLL